MTSETTDRAAAAADEARASGGLQGDKTMNHMTNASLILEDPHIGWEREAERLRALSEAEKDEDKAELFYQQRAVVWDRIDGTPATTVAGLSVQCRRLMEIADGHEVDPGSALCKSIVAGLERLEAAEREAGTGALRPPATFRQPKHDRVGAKRCADEIEKSLVKVDGAVSALLEILVPLPTGQALDARTLGAVHYVLFELDDHQRAVADAHSKLSKFI